MSAFSDESRLLVNHWEAVEDVLEAERRLRVELSELITSVERSLADQEWWRDGWVYVRQGESHSYISHSKWKVDAGYAIWIGVENVNPKAVFGSEAPPGLYVWVLGRHSDLIQYLSEHLSKDSTQLIGEIDSGSSGYVVRHAIRKCLPEELDDYAEMVRKQISEFIAFYAKMLMEHNSEILEHIGRA